MISVVKLYNIQQRQLLVLIITLLYCVLVIVAGSCVFGFLLRRLPLFAGYWRLQGKIGGEYIMLDSLILLKVVWETFML